MYKNFFRFLLVLFVFGLLFTSQSNPVNAQIFSSSDPDMNIRLRNAIPSSNLLDPTVGIIQKYHFGSDAEIDPKAPQLNTLFNNSELYIKTLYQLHERDSGALIPSNGTANWGSTLVGMTSPGVTVKVPQGGYDIGGGYQVTILYMDDGAGDITMSYTAGEAGITLGYVVHLLNFNIAPELVTLYNQGKSEGKIIALPCGYALGTIKPSELQVSIRDTGTFFDPRSGYDWWQALIGRATTPLPCNLTLQPKLITPGTAPGGGSAPIKPIPTPKEIPCNEVSEYFGPDSGQFHAYRPYPGNPCNKEVTETVLYCANDLVVKKTFRVTPGQAVSCRPGTAGAQVCSYKIPGNTANVEVNLADAELPILGNTELVPNRINPEPASILTAAQRVNEYVSWYLNGTNYFADEDPLNMGVEAGIRQLVDYAGPIKKLLPMAVQTVTRIKTVTQGDQSRNNGAEIRHDQTVGCISLAGSLNTNLLVLGCSKDMAKIPAAIRDNFRGLLLTDFARQPSWFKPLRGLPPLEKDYTNFKEYWKDYQEWRGSNCRLISNIFGTELYMCFNLGDANPYSALFQDIPLSSTEDRKGTTELALQETDKKQNIGGSEIEITKVTEKTDIGASLTHQLFFSHIQEDSELADLLQSTYVSQSQVKFDNQTTDVFPSDKPFCELKESRSNPGDDLYGEYNAKIQDNGNGFAKQDKIITADVEYTANFECEFKPNAAPAPACVDSCVKAGDTLASCQSQCTQSNICEKDVFVALKVHTNTPKANELWERLVDGPQGIFKKMFPLIKEGDDSGPITEIKDLPGVTKASYTANGVSTEALAGDPNLRKSGTNAELFIPHLGGIQEYFLKAIQKALRPKDLQGPLEGISGELNTDPGSAQCSVVDYDIPYTNTNIEPKTKFQLAQIFGGQFPGNQIIAHYDEVVRRAKASGYNPAFALTIWIEETGASDRQSFGNQVWDFGCGAATPGDFSSGLNCFLGLKNFYSTNNLFSCRKGTNGANFEDFMLFFAEGTCKTVEQQNRQFCGGHKPFPARIKKFYDQVVK